MSRPEFVDTKASDVKIGDALIMNGTGISGIVLDIIRPPLYPNQVLFLLEGWDSRPFKSHVNTRHYVETVVPS